MNNCTIDRRPSIRRAGSSLPFHRGPCSGPRRHGDESGQSTTEYALVLVVVAVVAAVLITAGPKAIGDVFDKVIDVVSSKIHG